MQDAATGSHAGNDGAEVVIDAPGSAGRKRDNRYFERRLEHEHPEIWAVWQAGGFPSLRAACLRAGLMRQRSRASELKNAWKKASVDERVAFIGYLRDQGILRKLKALELALPEPEKPEQRALPDVPDPAGQAFPWKVAVNGYLTPEAKTRILEIMHRREMIGENGSYHVGMIMTELGRGFRSQDPSLSSALRAGWRIRPELVKALEKWLDSQPSRSG